MSDCGTEGCREERFMITIKADNQEVSPDGKGGVRTSAFPKIELEADMKDIVCYDDTLRPEGFVRSITVRNGGPLKISGVTFHAFSSDGILENAPQYGPFDLEAFDEVSFDGSSLRPDGRKLARLGNEQEAVIRFEITRPSEEQGKDEIIASLERTVRILAYDEWAGAVENPESLVGFIQPDHPRLSEIITKAGALLKLWTGDGTFDGYLSGDQNRVITQASAFYIALRDLGITYEHSAPGFGMQPGRVRFADELLDGRLAGNLDLALIFASLFESSGIYPILFQNDRHFFVGFHLGQSFGETGFISDPASVQKYISDGIGKFVVFEPTLVTQSGTNLETARRTGELELRDSVRPVRFIYDAAVLNLNGFRSLPVRMKNGAGIYTASGEEAKKEEADCAEISFAAGDGAAGKPENADEPAKAGNGAGENEGRGSGKESAGFLDLTTGNPLIDVNSEKDVLPVFTVSMDDLVRQMKDGTEFSVYGRPEEWPSLMSDDPVPKHLPEPESYRSLVIAEATAGRLRSLPDDAEVKEKMRRLLRASRENLMENGESSLFLAFGLLKWYENDHSAEAHYAPIELLPAEIAGETEYFPEDGAREAKPSARNDMSVRLAGTKPIFNRSLFRMLRGTFGISLERPLGTSGQNISDAVEEVRQAVFNMKRWEVLDFVCVGNFPADREALYFDLEEKKSRTGSLFSKTMTDEVKTAHAGAESESTDSHLYPILMDSEERSAARAILDGESFRYSGAPGTGKTETLTAAAASAISEGQRILYVSQKPGVLKEARKRFRALGVERFVLDVIPGEKPDTGGTKMQRADADLISGILRRRLSEGLAAAENPAVQGHIRRDRQEEISKASSAAEAYRKAVQEKRQCGMSLWEMVSEFESMPEKLPAIPCDVHAAGLLTRSGIEEKEKLAESLIRAAEDAGAGPESELLGVTEDSYDENSKDEVLTAVDRLSESLEGLKAAATKLDEALAGNGLPEAAEDYSAAKNLADKLSAFEGIPTAMIFADPADLYIRNIREMCEADLKADEIRDSLSMGADGTGFDEGFFTLDGDALKNQWDEAESKFVLAKSSDQNKVLRALQQHSRSRIGRESVPAVLSQLIRCREARKNADALNDLYLEDLGGEYKNPAAVDWQKLKSLSDRAIRADNALDSEEGGKELRMKLSEDPSKLSEVLQAAAGFRDAFDKEKEAEEKLSAYVSFGRGGLGSGRDFADACSGICRGIRDNIDQLPAWSRWNAQKKEAEESGLGALTDAVLKGSAETGELLPSFRKGLLAALIKNVVSSSPALVGFTGEDFTDTLHALSKELEAQAEDDRKEIAVRLERKIRDARAKDSFATDAVALRHTLRNGNASGTGVLLGSAPELVKTLFPCVLTTPAAAVRMQIDTGFDAVLMDDADDFEASDILSMAVRGKSAVIVSEADPAGTGLPVRRAGFYKQKNEGRAAAFINCEFRGNQMRIIPCPGRDEDAVAFVKVHGSADEKADGTNPAEAKAVIREIIRRAVTPDFRDETVAVCALTRGQRDLIEDLFYAELRKDQDLCAWYRGGEKRRVFFGTPYDLAGTVKDAEILSVVFCPDEEGNVRCDRGILAEENGRVLFETAITRGTRSLTVFSSIDPDVWDPEKPGPAGDTAESAKTDAEKSAHFRLSGEKDDEGSIPAAKLLYDFLRFVKDEARKGRAQTERGQIFRGPSGAGQEKEVPDGILNCLKEEFSREGFRTESDYGWPVFTIDLAAAEESGESAPVAVLSDGPDGVLTRTSKDIRDADFAVRRLMENGWQVQTAFTMDFWNSREKTVRKILAAASAGNTAVAAEAGTAENQAEEQSSVTAKDEKPAYMLAYMPADIPAEENEGTEKQKEPAGDTAPANETSEKTAEDIAASDGEALEKTADSDLGDAASASGEEAVDTDALHGASEGTTENTAENIAEANDTSEKSADDTAASNTAAGETSQDNTAAENAFRGVSAPDAAESIDLEDGGVPYSATVLPVVKMTTSEFADPASEKIIWDYLARILEHEAPISEELLIKRVLAGFGLTRIGNKVKHQVLDILQSKKVFCTAESGTRFYWAEGQKPEDYTGFRTSGSGNNRRDVADVPIEEARNAVVSVLSSGIAMKEEDLCSAAADALGYKTMRESIFLRMEKGITLANEEGRIRQNIAHRWVIAGSR